MIKKDLIEEISERTGLSRNDTTACIEHALLIIEEAFVRKEDVVIRGFGSFRYTVKKPKVARNISTGTSIHLPAEPTIKFKISNLLKSKLS